MNAATATRIALLGDVMLGRLVNDAIQALGPAYPWGDVLPALRGSDLVIANLECVIARGGRPWARWPKAFHFRADPAAIETLRRAGIACVNLANNHVLDFELEAFDELLDLLDANGIAHVGAGRTLAEAREPALLTVGALRVGVVGFTDNEPGWAATPTTPGVNWIRIEPAESSLGPIREAIARARAAGADLVVCTPHWGPNMVLRPSLTFQSFARAVIEAGADVWLGHSAHVFQGIEVWRGKPIIYDAGDFVDDYAVDPQLRNDWGLLIHGVVADRRVSRLEIAPLRIDRCQVNHASGDEVEAILARLAALSGEFGTAVHRANGRAWIGCDHAT